MKTPPNTTLDNRVTALETRATSDEARLTTDETRIAAVEARVSVLEVGGVDDDSAIVASVTALSTRVTALEAGGTGGGTGGGGLPPDSNVYPLKMPVVADGANVEIGVGSDMINLALAGWDGVSNIVAIAITTDQMAKKFVAGPLAVTAYTGSDAAGQRFKIYGTFGSGHPRVQIASGGDGVGIDGLFVNEVSYNFIPLVYNGPTTDGRGALLAPNAHAVWDNIGIPMEFNDQLVDVVSPPPSPPPLTQDLIDGKTLQAIVDPGGDITLPSGTFHAACQINLPAVITGTNTVITGDGGLIANGKGLFVVETSLTLNNIRLTGAKVDDNNGAGVRGDPGAIIVMQGCEVDHNEDGILAGATGVTVAIDACHFHDNGYGAGAAGTHEIYVGGDLLTATNSTFKCGVLSTHAIKSRAKKSVIQKCHLTGSPDTTGDVAGSVLDVPDGGDLLVEDTTIEMAVGQANHVLFGYALESAINGLRPVVLRRVHVIDTSGSGGLVMAGNGGTTLTLDGCTYAGTVPPVMNGWTSVTGSFTAA